MVAKQYNGGVKLVGLPLGTFRASLSAFLFGLLEHQPAAVKHGVEVLSVEEHQKSCSALVRIPRGKKVYLRFAALLKETPLQGKFIRAQLCPQLPSSSDVEKRQQQVQDRKALAKAFYKHILCQHDATLLSGTAAIDRKRGGKLFQDFYRTYRQNHGERVDDDESPSSSSSSAATVPVARRELESHVMALLCNMGLLRTERRPGGTVMLFKDQEGNFPTAKEAKDAVSKIRQERAKDMENKFGVTVSAALDQSFIKLKELVTISLRVESFDPTVELERVVVSGANCRSYKLRELQFPLTLGKAVNVELEVTAVRIGVLRSTVTFYFHSHSDEGGDNSNFRIARYLSVRSGLDKEMDKLLAPTTPYVRKKTMRRAELPEEVYDPPKIPQKTKPGPQKKTKPGRQIKTKAGGDGADIPFTKLGQHRISADSRSLLETNEFGNTIESPIEETAEGYGRFWKKLLWASEFQSNRDIRLFDMEDVALQKSGRSLSLHVPGLAEGRPSVLRGDVINVTWNNRLYKGRVNQVRLLEILPDFHPSFHKEYKPSFDRVNVGFTFSRTTFRTNHEGCVAAEKSMGPRMLFPNPSDVLSLQQQSWTEGEETSTTSSSGEQQPSTSSWVWADRHLNAEQQTAVTEIVKGALRPLPYIIFGPPGTGKTTTVVEAVYQLAMRKKLKILLVAPSNDAADILVERLSPMFPPSEMRRLLAYSRPVETMTPSIRSYASEESPEKQMGEILSARIVVSTVNLASRFSFYGVPVGHFDVLCVDEAGHSTEPEIVSVAATLMNFTVTPGSSSSSGQMILAGDPKQLGPIITSSLCRSLGMSTSYLERLSDRIVYGKDDDGKYPTALLTKLIRNYRSHPAIIKLPNEMFYDNELQCCGDIDNMLTTHNMANWEHLPKRGFPVMFHSMDGDNLRESNSPSWFNPQEAQQVVAYAKLLMQETRPPLRAQDIGIITPYARQAQKIRLALTSAAASSSQGNSDIDMNDIKVGSVEVFQGQERRCIIISTVRSDPEHVSSDLRYNLGFVANAKRFNVAMTRAKTLLIVVGCARVLALDQENWLPFLRYCKENGSWAGEEWDPVDTIETSETEEVAGSEQEEEAAALVNTSVDSDDWHEVDAPSQAAEEEAFAVFNQEV